MDNIKSAFYAVFFIINCFAITCESKGQDSLKRYTLDQVIELANERSPKVLEAKGAYLNSYWTHRSFIASNLPQISLGPVAYNYNHSLIPTYNKDSFLVSNNINTGLGINISQSIPYTGGQLLVSSNLMSAKDIKSSIANYSSTLYSIQYSQPLTLFNSFKWQNKTESFRMKQAKLAYLQSVEQISSEVIDLFFGVVSTQINYEIALLNYANADTLYKLSKGRYKIGKIVESDLLQMELSFLQAGINLTTVKLEMETQKSNLRSFLALPNDEKFELIVPNKHSIVLLDFNETMQLVKENNPDFLNIKVKLIEAERNVKQAYYDNWLNNGNFTATYGLSSFGTNLGKITTNSSIASGFSFGISIPIVGYGIKKGKYKVAKLNRLIANEQANQQLNNIKQNILNIVTRFNQQDDLLKIAALSDTIAQKRYFISKQRFILGKIDVLDLNKATTDKDNARNQFINALHNYWNIYYQIRKLTLYDFISNKSIQVDTDEFFKE